MAASDRRSAFARFRDILTFVRFLCLSLPWTAAKVTAKHALGLANKKGVRLSLQDDAILTICRRATEVISPAFLLNAADHTANKILTSPRYSHLREHLLQPVRREGFSGYWLHRGVSTTPLTPKDSDLVVFHMHGGGYVLGHPSDNLADLLFFAERLQRHDITCSAFSVEYSLAPEKCLPTPVSEAVAAYRYLVEEEDVDPAKIILMGESAGGHLALALLTALQVPTLCSGRGTGLPKPGYTILLSPWVDLLNSDPSFRVGEKTDILSKKALDRNAARVLKETSGEDRTLLANFGERVEARGSWKEILPELTWVSAGQYEALLGDITRFVHNARKDEVDVGLRVGSKKIHAWEGAEAYFNKKKLLGTEMAVEVDDLMEGYRGVVMTLVEWYRGGDGASTSASRT